MTGLVTTHDVTISAADLKHIVPRSSLHSVMGGSAAAMSGIANSEWLHAVAHSLGGPDAVSNLAAGPHSLNTAMIPFETAVKRLVHSGLVVDYHVTFFTQDLPGTAMQYISAVEIGIEIHGGTQKDWTLVVNSKDIEKFINGQVLAEIEGVAGSFGAASSSSASSSSSSGGAPP